MSRHPWKNTEITHRYGRMCFNESLVKRLRGHVNDYNSVLETRKIKDTEEWYSFVYIRRPEPKDNF